MANFDISYYKNTYNAAPSELLVKALSFSRQNVSLTLDLGCGAGRDTRLLLEKGFIVTAVDAQEEVAKYLHSLSRQEKLTFVHCSFYNFQFQKYDIINARYALPFSPPDEFNVMFQRLKDSLLPGGVFVGQLFGPNDEWNTPASKMTFHSLNEVKYLLADLEILEITETDKSGSLADGSSKHWHVFDIIARKSN